MTKKFTPILAMLTFVATSAFAASGPTVTQDDMITGINQVKDVFVSTYAMQVWKKDHLKVDVAQSFDAARSEITSDMTLKEFQRLLKRTLSNLNDYHVSIRFFKTEAASLPLTIRGAEGKYFVAYIDRTKLSKVAFPFEIGDEVVEFAGKPVADSINDIKSISYGGVAETDQALAELNLTSRTAARGLDVPSGPVVIKVLPRGAAKARPVQLIWSYTPEAIQTDDMAMRTPLRDQSDDQKLHFKNTEMLMGDFSKKDIVEENPFGLGTKKSFIPELGQKVWEASETNHFNAYTFKKNGKLIGYIRIPHYSADGSWIVDFAEIVKTMEATTDGLIIDEINNPGGSVFYLYALVSLLTQEPMYTPKHQIKLTAADVVEARTLREQLKNVKTEDDAKAVFGSDMGGYPITLQFVEFAREWTRFIASEWSAGRTLTTPNYLYGVDQINPYPGTTYSKPILLLINQLDFSGGDFFPAILQDNKRVTVMGVRTAGAGGYIKPTTYPNRLGIDTFVVTGSLAHRIGDEPIENLGVTPDVNYELTAKDFTGGFQEYKSAILKNIEALIN